MSKVGESMRENGDLDQPVSVQQEEQVGEREELTGTTARQIWKRNQVRDEVGRAFYITEDAKSAAANTFVYTNRTAYIMRDGSRIIAWKGENRTSRVDVK